MKHRSKTDNQYQVRYQNTEETSGAWKPRQIKREK